MSPFHLLPRKRQSQPPPERRGLSLTRVVTLLAATVAVAIPSALMPSVSSAAETEPLPQFVYSGEVTVAENLSYNPTGEFIFPSVFHAGEHLADPLAEWYLYYAPHENPGGISLMYSDSLSGPWTEYEANPVISNVWSPIYSVNHVSSPDAIWNEQEQTMFLYFHGGNDQTRFATSDDGVSFEYGGSAVTNAMGGTDTRESTYARVFTHPDPSSTYNYGMFYMENTTANSRRIRLAESVDGRTWTVRPTPVVYPGSLDAGNVSAANLWEWGGQLYVTYHASSGKSFARPIDATLTTVGEPVLLHASSGVGDDTGRVAAPEIVTDETGTYLFYESGERLGATIRYATATDAAPPAPAFSLNTTGTATTSCVGEAVNIRVDAQNGSTAPADIRIVTPLGEKKFTGVSPSGEVVANFTGTSGSIAAGKATLNSFARVNDVPYTSSTEVSFPAITCDNTAEEPVDPPPAPAFTLNTTGTATTSCVGEAANIRVDAQNGSTARADIRIITPLGEKKFTGVSPAGEAVANFTGTSGSIAAGKATINSFARVDGVAYTSSTEVSFPAITCDNTVEEPVNTPPTVEVTGISEVATYEIGAEPTPICAVNDAEDSGEAAVPTIGPASGSHGLGLRNVTCTYTDGGGLSATQTASYTVVDTGMPTLTGAPTTVPNAAGWYRGDVAIHWMAEDTGAGIDSDTLPADEIISTEGSGQTRTASVADWAGNTATATSAPAVNIDKTDPTVGTPSVDPKAVDQSSNLSVAASDNLSGVVGGEFFLESDPGNGNGTPLSLSADGTELTHTFGTTLAPGTYTVGVRSVDAAGNWSTTTTETLVVFDPNGGFLTGGGHIASPAGAWTADPASSGRATFSFVSKYQKGATTPTGKFQFSAGDLKFTSTASDWLVITEAQAQYQGSGTLNGVTGYEFLLTATDGALNGGEEVDRFHLKITKDSTVVYDNLLGSAGDLANDQALTGGSIVIHAK